MIAFPYHDWRKAQVEGCRWRDAHILQHMAGHPAIEHILIVDRPVTLPELAARHRSPFVRGRRVARRRLGTWVAQLTEVAPRLTVLDVLSPDLIGPVRDPYRWWFDVFAALPFRAILDWATVEMGLDQPQVVGWTPTMIGALPDREKRGRVVFDSLDNWLIHPTLRRYSALASPAYERLSSEATVVVSAPASRAVFERWTSNVHLIPNGVDPDGFAGSPGRPPDLPNRPIVGYAGSLGPRIDTALVRATAERLPDVAFVFIGQILDRDTMMALRAPNIHYLGDRHYDDVAAYLAHFDVAWIPHTVGREESGGDPIKLYEYMAAQRPIVSTPIDGHEAWPRWVHVVDRPESAAEIVRAILNGQLPTTLATVPVERTWLSIADRVVGLLRGPP